VHYGDSVQDPVNVSVPNMAINVQLQEGRHLEVRRAADCTGKRRDSEANIAHPPSLCLVSRRSAFAWPLHTEHMTPGNLDPSVPPAKAKEFSPYVAEHLRWYVYALRDPRDQRVFYVGKGCGNRVFQHARAALAVADGSEPVSTKIAQILDIIAAGLSVDAVILRHGIPSEKAAYDVEAAIIDTLRLLDPALANDRFELTNLVLGHQHATKGLVNADVVATLYDAPTAPPILAPSILFRIPALWTPQMSSEELYEATRGWWVVGPNPRVNAKYAFAVSKGVVRGIYRITSWRERREGDRDSEQDLGKNPRWGFAGEPATEMGAWLNTSVAHLFKKGEANPVKAVNLISHPESETSRDTIAFTVSGDGIILELIRIGAEGLFVRRSCHWREIDPSVDDSRIEGREWIDVTEDGIALWDRADCSATQISRADALRFATDPSILSTGGTEPSVVGLAPGLENEAPTGHRSRKLSVSAAKSDSVPTASVPTASVPTVEWLRTVGSLHGVDPWDGGLTWTRYVPHLWALRPSLDDTAGWLPPDPRHPGGQAEEAAIAWWTPLLHLTRFQMGLGRPGADLAWLRSDPVAAAEHSPLTGAQFALMDKWWGIEAVEDFIAWAITSGDNHRPPGDDEDGTWPGDGAASRLSQRERSRYERRTQTARWQASWGGGTDPMHLSDHAIVPFGPTGQPGGVSGPPPIALVRSGESRLRAALTPGWRREENSNMLHVLSPDYAGWYGELLAHGRALSRQTPVRVVIDGFGPLGTFAIGAGQRPRMIAYPQWSARHRALSKRLVWTDDQVTVTPPPSPSPERPKEQHPRPQD